MPSVPKLDSTASTLVIAAVLAAAITAGVTYLPDMFAGKERRQPQASVAMATGSGPAASADATRGAAAGSGQVWKASAPGRVQPKGGTVHVRPEVRATIVDVIAAANDRVRAGDILVLLNDDEILAKIAAAKAEVAVRLGERDEEVEKKPLVIERRKADDALASAERKVHEAQVAFDRLFLARRKGDAKDAEVDAQRKAITAAKELVVERQKARDAVLAKAGMPAPTRLDSGLMIARSELRVAEINFDRARVRALSDGIVLRVEATVGEAASPGSPMALVEMGDISALEVRAEVDERDVSKISVGQLAVLRSNAFPGRDFTGKTVSVAPALGSPALKARGPSKPSDVDVLEVKIALDGPTPLMPGMRVDVFFKNMPPVKAAANAKK
ncbi:MAG TPA: efflux RND transporter periplasmic adaptor subunit [Hyphomicrobiaceae bacterium]|nr:efflux RND transporter periplasmic adaptor subunit [Hyphomicrobiaceae bacterium]